VSISDALPLPVKERKEAAWKETISPGLPGLYLCGHQNKQKKNSQILSSDAKEIYLACSIT